MLQYIIVLLLHNSYGFVVKFNNFLNVLPYAPFSLPYSAGFLRQIST